MRQLLPTAVAGTCHAAAHLHTLSASCAQRNRGAWSVHTCNASLRQQPPGEPHCLLGPGLAMAQRDTAQHAVHALASVHILSPFLPVTTPSPHSAARCLFGTSLCACVHMRIECGFAAKPPPQQQHYVVISSAGAADGAAACSVQPHSVHHCRAAASSDSARWCWIWSPTTHGWCRHGRYICTGLGLHMPRVPSPQCTDCSSRQQEGSKRCSCLSDLSVWLMHS